MPEFGGAVVMPYQTPPATPPTGKGVWYFKLDGKLYAKDDAGTEYDLTAIGSGATGWGDCATVTTDNVGLTQVGQTVNGVVITEGMRVLVPYQTNKTQNGIYVAGAVWTRAADADASSEFTRGKKVFVSGGWVGGQDDWAYASVSNPVLGTTELLFLPPTQEQVAVFTEAGTLVAPKTGKARFRFPYPVIVMSVTMAVDTAPTGGNLWIDVNKVTVAAPTVKTSIYTNQGGRPNLGSGAYATTSDFKPDTMDFAAGDAMTVDIDSVGPTVAGADLTVCVRYRRTA